MILSGTLDSVPEPVSVRLTADVTDFVRYLVTTARQLLVLDLKLEVLNLNADQVWARFYTRGALHPDFAGPNGPDAVDHYLRALTRINGDRGHAARAGFLQGWVDHRASDNARQLLAWHRLIGDTAVSVGREQESES